MIRRTFIAASLFALVSIALASSKPAPPKPATVVDQGSFVIFQNGQRIATETFIIRQLPDSNTTSSELHDETGSKVEQSSELTLLPDGSFSHYLWKQASPVRSTATVEPGDQVLNMHVVADGKNTDQTFLLSRATFVLDDYFFSTREVLLWRYLSSSCKPHPTGDGGCDLVKARFPVLIPRRHISAQVYIEFKGYENTPLNGRPQRLRHFLLTTDGPDWHLWLDENHHLLRISIPDTGTEVLRQEK